LKLSSSTFYSIYIIKKEKNTYTRGEPGQNPKKEMLKKKRNKRNQ